MDSTAEQDLRSRFLNGMSHAACTVNVVTTNGTAGRAGVTVSAMSSVSADTEKPTLLVCVHHQSPAAAAIVENGVFCVNVLRDDQSYISDTFAGRFKNEVYDKFDCAEWLDCETGAPRIADGLVAFDCRLQSGERVGSHHIFLGEVQNLHISRPGSPLIYANRAYVSSSCIESASAFREAVDGERSTLAVGYFHTFGPFLIPKLLAGLPDINVKLVEGDQRRLSEGLASGECELALLYDIGLDENLDAETLTELWPYVLLPAGHSLTDQREVTPQELADEPMILLDTPPSAEYFTGIMKSAGVKPVIRQRTTSLEMLRGMVGHGLGYALLATKPVSGMSYDGMRLVTRPLAGNPESSRVVLAHRKGQRLSPAADRFASTCRSAFTSRESEY